MNHTNDRKESPHMSSNCPQIIKEQPLPTTHSRCWGLVSNQQGSRLSQGAPPAPRSGSPQ